MAERYALEDQIGFRLRRAHQRATEIFNGVMAGFEVTPTQFAALATLLEHGPLAQNQLGRMTAMDPATIFGVVGRLAKRGWVRQDVDPKDGRVVIVSLTDGGREVTTAMVARGPDVSAETLAPLSADEARTLLDLLARLA